MSAERVPHPLPEELVELLSERMFLLGDPTRIRIMDRLRYAERNVQSIADSLATTQQNVSGHLRLLRTGGVVCRRRDGREAFYATVDDSAFEVWGRLLAGFVDERQ